MTWNDEIVEEVRKVREKHAAEFDYDISAICADIRRRQIESGREIVSLEKDEKEVKESNLPKAA
jgi:hypothetical protein